MTPNDLRDIRPHTRPLPPAPRVLVVRESDWREVMPYPTEMVLDRLRELLVEEPPQTNEGEPIGLASEKARVHNAWEEQVSAYRLILGIWMVNEALEGVSDE